MAATKKNSTAKAPAKKQTATQTATPKATTPTVTAQIDKMVDLENSKIKAFASATIGGAFAVHNIRVMDGGEKGLYVSMPFRTYQKDGNTAYQDTFHAITAEARTELNNSVMQAYEQKLQEEMTEDAEQTMDTEELPFEPKM